MFSNSISLDVWEKCGFWSMSLLFVTYLVQILTDVHFLILFIPVWTMCFVLIILFNSLMLTPSKDKAILITGCDTGFGHSISKRLHKMGFTVFAGCLSTDTEGAKALANEYENDSRFFVIPMDVSSEDSCKKAIEFLKNNLPSSANGGLWAVITNAGLASFGHLEWTPIEVYERLMNINCLGSIRTIKSALPLIRKAKGRIILISSQMGLFGNASRSSYCCSKWAIEGLFECLRLEMKNFGVHVSCLEPGNFVAGTNIFGGEVVQKQAQEMWNKMSEECRISYGKENFDQSVQTFWNFVKNGNSNINPVLDTMVKAVVQKYPQTRYQVMTLRERIRVYVAKYCYSYIYDKIYN